MTRRIVPSREVYHLWANQSQSDARNSSGSVSFRDSGAYSYRALIGRIVNRPRKGRAFLLTTQTWSVTTSKHQSYCRRAIPSDARVFNVAYLNFPDTPRDGASDDAHRETHRLRIADYKQRIGAAALRANRARKLWRIESAQGETATLIREVYDYCDYFGLRKPKIDVDTIRTDLDRIRAKEAVEIATREERLNARIERLRIEYSAKANLWRNGQIDRMPNQHGDVLLRVVPSDFPQPVEDWTVETSMGARVPYCVAQSLFLDWLYGDVQEGDSVGPYTVSRVDGDTAIRIGCHLITMAEARRFAVQEEWIDSEVTT